MILNYIVLYICSYVIGNMHNPQSIPIYRVSIIIRVFTITRYRLLDSLVVECWLRVREVPGSIPSQGPSHTKDVIKMVPVVPLFSTEH